MASMAMFKEATPDSRYFSRISTSVTVNQALATTSMGCSLTPIPLRKEASCARAVMVSADA